MNVFFFRIRRRNMTSSLSSNRDQRIAHMLIIAGVSVSLLSIPEIYVFTKTMMDKHYMKYKTYNHLLTMKGVLMMCRATYCIINCSLFALSTSGMENFMGFLNKKYLRLCKKNNGDTQI